MNSILQIENVTKSYGDRILFSDISIGIGQGDKVGLIAKNGTGKTTLMRIISGEEPVDSGEVVMRNGIKLSFLEQVPEIDPEATVIDYFLGGEDERAQVLREYEQAAASGDSGRIAAAIQAMDNIHAWDYETRFKNILSRLRITDCAQRAGELSGGQLKRVALAKAILDDPDVLLLDEPTNHLDIEAIEWLEDYSSKSKMTLLMVTHDRYFLDRVCNKIMEIDMGSVWEYNGNYGYYLEKRQERIAAENVETARAKNLLRTELEWMRRQPQARGTKAKYRIDAFYDLKERAQVKRDERDVRLEMGASYIGSKIFEAQDVRKSFGEKKILDGFNYVFARYERVGIVGDNGAGKSTFIKCLLGIELLDGGRFDIGETVRFGYCSQEGIQFDENEKVIDAVRKIAEYVRFDEKRSYTAQQFLQMFLFPVAEQQKLIGKLSGGEKRRLYLATVLMRKPNFLVLDEPTNDLDIRTLEVLEEYLSQYKGCLIIVSHDRFFMDRTVDHIFVFEGNGVVKDFPGSYTDYREAKAVLQKEQSQAEVKPKTPQPHNAARERTSNKKTYKEKKEFEQLGEEIERLTREKEEMTARFNSGEVIDDIEALSRRYTELCAELDEKELRWLELSEKD